MPTYLKCDGAVTQTNNGVYVRCRIDEGVESFTEQQIQDQFTQGLTPEQHTELGTQLWVICAFCWGGRQILRTMSFR